MKITEIPTKQNQNPVTDPTTQVSAEEFNAIVDTAKGSINSVAILPGQEEVKLSCGKNGGGVSEVAFPNASDTNAGMMSKEQAMRIKDSIKSVEILPGQEEVKLSCGKNGGGVSEVAFPNASDTNAGMMSKEHATRINDSIKSVEILPGQDEVKLSCEKNGGGVSEVAFPNASDTNAGMMSKEQAIRIADSIKSVAILPGQEEVKLSCGKNGGGVSEVTFPNASDENAGMMSKEQAIRIADRAAGSAMGYVILDNNRSFAEQVVTANTIYEIRYDFNLNGAGNDPNDESNPAIKIPANCALKFEGGKLFNGKLEGNSSLITGSEYNILDQVTLTGKWANAECNLKWWGCDSTAGVDNSTAIQHAFNSTIPIVRVSEQYGISCPVRLPYSKTIIGKSGLNNKKTGFYANSDFEAKDVPFEKTNTIPAYTRNVSALFYFRESTMAELRGLYFDANYKADFALEHIDSYCQMNMYDLYIIRARKAGILYYASEFPIFDHVYVSLCNIGIIITNFKFKDGNPMNSEFYTGERVGQANLVSLSKVRCLNNNYGIILNGLYDCLAEDTETAYNSIAGMIVYNSSVDFLKYYSEGDGSCDFLIKEGLDANGDNKWGMVYYRKIDDSQSEETLHTEEYQAIKDRKEGYALPSLVAADLDGKKYRCLATKLQYNNLRAPLLVINSTINLSSAFISFHPRSTTRNNPDSYEPFTRNDVQGVDAMILLDTAQVTIGILNRYVLTSGTKTALYASILGNFAKGGSVVVQKANHAVEVLPLTRTQITGEKLDAGKAKTSWNISYEGCRANDYNKNIESAQYQYKTIDKRSYKYISSYANRPLYQHVFGNNTQVWISRTELANRFPGKKAVMLQMWIQVTEDVTTRLGLQTVYFDGNYKGLLYHTSNEGAEIEYKAGLYKFDMPVLLGTFFDYEHLLVSEDCTNKNAKLNTSHYYFYDIEDGLKLPHNFTSVTLPNGTTEGRPTPSFAGQQYFDTTLGKTIVWNGSAWIDATGATV